jgi:hypothetical protein
MGRYPYKHLKVHAHMLTILFVLAPKKKEVQKLSLGEFMQDPCELHHLMIHHKSSIVRLSRRRRHTDIFF